MSKAFSSKSLAALFTAAFVACSGGGGSTAAGGPVPPPPPPPSAAVQHIVDVTGTDAQIDASFGSHYAYYNASVTPKGKLFLFFGATDSKPENYTIVEEAAADAGFHTLGFAFPNGPNPVNLSCLNDSDPNCTGNIREETWSGVDASPYVEVNPANSIQNRLFKALVYLRAHFPNEGWDQFLSSGNSIAWDKIRVSGLSQGGGTAGYIAKQKVLVDRVCFFSSPADWDDTNNRPAAWILDDTQLTPPNRIYGFNHREDLIVPYAHIQQTWSDFGLDAFGAPVDADTTAPPYSNSHTLFSDLSGFSDLQDHVITASNATPLGADGLPVYLPVWQYACFR